MLLQFSVENYLSFDAMTHFSMRAGDEANHPGHVLAQGQHRAVRGAALYGANAAGKSNLVLAMGFARDVIVRRKGSTTSLNDARPFRLRDGAARPSGFHWKWVHAGQMWSYGFDIQAGSVLEEYLFAQPEDGGQELLWFERKLGEEGALHIELGAILDDLPADDAQLLKLLAPRTSADELLLHRCRDNGINSVDVVFEWFEDVLLIVRAEADYEPLILEATEDEQFSTFLSCQMRDAGTGIMHTFALTQKIEKFVSNMPAHGRDNAKKYFDSIASTLNSGEFQTVGGDSGSDALLVVHKDSEGQGCIKLLSPIHQIKSSGQMEVFTWEEESEGTQRFLHLLPRLYRLQTRPTVLVIDEIERRLHTHLTRRLVDQAINIAPLPDSQLIFTTHDTNLLDQTLLRRDEIWFVDKDEHGASSLFSLAQFKDFEASDYERAYLLGLFEAIPYFRNSHQLSPALRGQDETPAA